MDHPLDEKAQKLEILTYDPMYEVNVFEGYFVGGYIFHTHTYGETRSTWNSGVNLKGDIDYFGVLEEVIELKYVGRNSVVLFKCAFRDSIMGIKKHPIFDMIDVKYSTRHRGDDVFILASQAQQVYMTPYPHRNPAGVGWWAVWKTKARSTIDISYESSTATNESSLEGCYQEDEMPDPANISSDEPIDILTNRNVDEFEDVLSVDLPIAPPQPGRLALVEAEYDSEDVDGRSSDEDEGDSDDEDEVDLEFETLVEDHND